MWLLLRFSSFILTVLFLATGFILSQRLNKLAADMVLASHEELQRKSIRHLWVITIVIAVTCLNDFLYSMLIDLTFHGSCSDLLGSDMSNAILFVIQRFISLVVWVWACLFVFWPRRIYEAPTYKTDSTSSGLPISRDWFLLPIKVVLLLDLILDLKRNDGKRLLRS